MPQSAPFTLNLVEAACRLLEAHEDVRLVRTSGLWETKAMYVTNQGDFINGVCEIETTLEPIPLLDRLQSIENQLKRHKTIDKGPRTIDLDILLYQDQIINEPRLQVPHKLMLERPFVLQPLCELIPSSKHPSLPEPSITYQRQLQSLAKSSLSPTTITPLAADMPPITALLQSRRTQVMSILNLTPDSFSDGGIHSTSDMAALETTIQAHIDAGATIIDVGGQSTRPKAADVGEDEESRRVVPAIRKIRGMIEQQQLQRRVGISIDTFRAPVARAAVEAGADIVNDVSGGTLDTAMLGTVAELGCSVVLMHMRGDPSTMTSKEHTSYPDGLLATIGRELGARVDAAEAAGIRRWRIMLDPGIGFAKTGEQNLEILRSFDQLRATPALSGLPWVVGPSRKRFLGHILGVSEARERVWGTAAAVSAAVYGGADVIRVHDVQEMAQTAKVADAIWRS
ncbi:MAG: hypothetical protein Q9162_006224 [Coniocarpon cinnabarinum]